MFLFTVARSFRSKEEKKAEKEQNEATIEEYGFCTMDGHKEKIGNFRLVIFPPVTYYYCLSSTELSLPPCSEVEVSTLSKE